MSDMIRVKCTPGEWTKRVDAAPPHGELCDLPSADAVHDERLDKGSEWTCHCGRV